MAGSTTYYRVPGMMYPYWAVSETNAHCIGASDTDMGDLDVHEWTEWFGPRAIRVSAEEALGGDL